MGYRHGEEAAQDALLLRGAALSAPPAAEDFAAAARGAAQDFPVSARDLMPAYQGAELGERLAELERRWIDSGFTLSRDELLG
jgi:poly(A) polymerase